MKKRSFSYLLLAFMGLSLLSCSNSDNSSIGIIKDDVISSSDIDFSIDSNSKNYDFNIINEGGSYILNGDINSSVIIDTKDEVTIVLDNCNINSDFAGIYVKKASKVYLNLVGNNTIKCLNEFNQIDDNKVDGAIFSKSDLTIKGDGELDIESIYHGVVSKDNLVITGGDISINASKKGIDVNDYLALTNTSIDIDSIADGIHVENSDSSLGYIYSLNSYLNINSTSDSISASGNIEIDSSEFNINSYSNESISNKSIKGIKGLDLIIKDSRIDINSKDDAIHSNSNIEIDGGSYNLTTEDDGIHADNNLVINSGDITISNSYEGLEGKAITINDGNINIISNDDGINAAGGNDGSSFNRPGQNSFNSSNSDVYITINGGVIVVDSKGDGIDSNGNLYVNGGNIIVYGPTDNGNGALDYDGVAKISGGSLCAIGSSGMAQNFSEAEQGSILYNLSSNYSSNTTINLKDSSGNIIYSVIGKKSFNSIVISTSDIKNNEAYTLNVGNNSYSITMSSMIYSNSSTSGFGPGGNHFGPRF